MRGNIYLQEFRAHFRSVVTWSLAIAVLIFVFVSLFPSFSQDAQLLNQMKARFPKELLAAFGLDGADLSTVLGYFSFVFLFSQICLAIQAANWGFSLVSVEEREWTADFLLAKPVSRTRILSSKLLAALSGLTITNAVVWISSFGAIQLYRGGQSFPAKPLLLLLASIVLFQLIFLSLSLAISLLVKRIRSVTPYAMALGFGMYVLSAFGDMLGQSFLETITPFRHFDPTTIIQNEAYDIPLVLLSVAATVVAFVASYVLYTRRDIASPV